MVTHLVFFHGAYIYFEKLRIREGKPKSKKRQEMEEMHAEDGGIDTKHMQDRLLTVTGKSWHHSAYGRTNLNGEVLLSEPRWIRGLLPNACVRYVAVIDWYVQMTPNVYGCRMSPNAINADA
jgi:hypothetical protein